MSDSPPATAPTPTTYSYLSQIAAGCRRQGCNKAADLADVLHLQLAERFGAERPPEPPSHPVWRDYLAALEQRRGYHARIDDRAGEVAYTCAISQVTRALRDSADRNDVVRVDGMQSAVAQVLGEVGAAFERIIRTRNDELVVARLTVQNKLKCDARRFHEQEQRDEIVATARLAAARARAAGVEI